MDNQIDSNETIAPQETQEVESVESVEQPSHKQTLCVLLTQAIGGEYETHISGVLDIVLPYMGGFDVQSLMSEPRQKDLIEYARLSLNATSAQELEALYERFKGDFAELNEKFLQSFGDNATHIATELKTFLAPKDDQEDTTPPKQESQNQQDANNLVQQATDELKQSGIALEDIIDNPPKVQVTPRPYPIDENRKQELENFDNRLDEALSNSINIKEHTRLNLEGLSELFKISKDIYAFYETQISTILISNNNTESLREEIAQIAVFINQTIESIHNTANTTLSIYKKCEQALDTATDIYTKLDTRAKQMNIVLENITSIKEQMQDLQALETSFKVLITKGEELRNQVNAIVPNILSEVKVTLLLDKESYEQDLSSQKDTYIQELTTLYGQINETIEDFNTDFATKELNINEANDRITQFLADLSNKAQEVATTHTKNLQELNNLSTQLKGELETLAQAKTDEYNTHTANLQNLYEEKKNALDTQHTDITNQVNTLKTNTISAVNTTLESKRDTTYNEVDNKIATAKGDLNTTHTQLKEDLQSLWEQYLNNLNSAAEGEIITIKSTIEQIQSDLQNYGLEHTRNTYTANATYTAPANTLYVYVFVQGGTGNGVASSFGSYVSAAGGSGGGSQKGSCASGFFKINANARVNVVVGQGGVCIVSTARKV